MKIRNLHIKDAQLMLEWMHDINVARFFRFRGSDYTLADAEQFILNASNDDKNRHLAITSDDDEYLGTVSLKSIDWEAGTAEYSIVLRSSAQNIGAGRYGTEQILRYAFETIGLNRVYLNVLSSNTKARGFYEHIGFSYEGEFKNHIRINGGLESLCWYSILKEDYRRQFLQSNSSDKYHKPYMLKFAQKGDERGSLVVVEGFKDVPFEIKRVFYIYGTEAQTVRGKHANRNSEFVLINVAGKSKVKTIDRFGDESLFDLDQPHIGIYLPRLTWKEMFDFSQDSILLVLSSEHYDKSEYITDINDFMQIIEKQKREANE